MEYVQFYPSLKTIEKPDSKEEWVQIDSLGQKNILSEEIYQDLLEKISHQIDLIKLIEELDPKSHK